MEQSESLLLRHTECF